MRRPGALELAVWGSLLVATNRSAFADERHAGRTLSEWVAGLAGDFSERQKATKALVEIGTPAVKPVLALIEGRRKGAGQAFETLGKMGEAAREALPVMMKIAKDAAWKAPDGWSWSSSPRHMALSGLRRMSWAADELVPFFLAIAKDASETDLIRRTAVAGLGGMGKNAAPALRTLTRSPHAAVRQEAHQSIITALSLDQKEYFAQVLEENPLDPNAPSYLGRSKGAFNIGRLDRLTEHVKTAMRERLAASPDPELSWALTTIIQDQLRGTSLQWAVPTGSASTRQARENPKESFATLAEAALSGFRSAEKGSDRRRPTPARSSPTSWLRCRPATWRAPRRSGSRSSWTQGLRAPSA